MQFATFALNGPTLIVIAILAVILFGRRLPEMGKSIGKSLKEFQKGMSGLEDDIDTVSAPKTDAARAQLQPPQRIPNAVPKFDDTHVTSEQPPAV